MNKIKNAILICTLILTTIAQANPNAVINLDAHYDKNHKLVTPDLVLLHKAIKAYEDGYNKSAYVKFKQSAAFGNTIAFRYLGLMHIKALGVDQNWAIGYAWIRLAAEDNSKENIELQQQILKNLKPEELEQSEIEYEKILSDYSASKSLMRRSRWVQRQKRNTTGSRVGSQTVNVKSQSIKGDTLDGDRTSSSLDPMNAFVEDYQFGVVSTGAIIPVEKEAKK